SNFTARVVALSTTGQQLKASADEFRDLPEDLEDGIVLIHCRSSLQDSGEDSGAIGDGVTDLLADHGRLRSCRGASGRDLPDTVVRELPVLTESDGGRVG